MCLATLSAPVVAEDVPKPDGMKLIYQHDFEDVRISRNIESGEVQVYFDDMQTPAMTATDKTFGEGRVGFGSFDDIGNFDDVRIYVPE